MRGDKMTEQMMTAAELAEAREFVRGVSTGPWKPNLSREHDWCIADCGEGDEGRWFVTTDNVPASELAGDSKTDAAFIAAARTLVPRLLATVEQLQGFRRDDSSDYNALDDRANQLRRELDAEKKAHADTARLAEGRLAERNSVQAKLDDVRATVDALTQRAERAEGDAAQVRATAQEMLAQVTECAQCRVFKHTPWKASEGYICAACLGKERDEALANLELARYQRDQFREQSKAALALADARGRALEIIIAECVDGMRHEDLGCPLDDTCECENVAKVSAACMAAMLPAPEALRQQQEREAGLVAIAQVYQQAIQALSLVPEGRGSSEETRRTLIERALSITPPQALREREERVGALERVAEAAKKYHEYYQWGGYDASLYRQLKSDIQEAVEGLEAVKGGR